MPYCSNCGKELKEGALFCGGCGISLKKEEPAPTPAPATNKRKEFFDGEAHLCPHCGTRLSSHQTYCPKCHNEIRGAKAVSSVDELSKKLEYINFDRTLSEEQKDKLIARTVRAFNIPNTKEDLLEFLDIANEKKDRKNYGRVITEAEEEVIGAWREKFRVAYRKAQSIVGDKQEIKALKEKYSYEYNNEEEYISNEYSNSKVNEGRNILDRYGSNQQSEQKQKNKWVRFFLCVFLGWAGAHKFYDGKKGQGMLYLCTMGLFGLGWMIDTLICLFKS